MRRFLPALVACALASTAAAQSTALVVLNKAEDTVSLFNPEKGTAWKKIDVGDEPHEAATSPDGKIVVVTNYGPRGKPGHTLSVIDMTKERVVKTIDLVKWHKPHGIVFLPGGKRLLVTCEREMKLCLVDLEAGKVEAAIDTSQRTSHMVAVSADAKRAFVANIRSGSVSVIDIEHKKLAKVIRTGAGAEGIAAHPTRPEVWVTNRSANSVSVIDTNKLEVVAELPCGRFPIRAAITPNGAHCLVSCGRSSEVAVFDVKTRKEIARVKMGVKAVSEEERRRRLFGDRFGRASMPIGLLIPPDGKLAYVANTYGDTVTVVDLATWKVVNQLKTGREPDGLAWVPGKSQ